MYFRYGMREMIRGTHPDDPGWPVHMSVNDAEHADALGEIAHWRASLGEQNKLIEIVARTPVRQLAQTTPFPDWLGHLGLVLWHTERAEKRSRMLTRSLTPQLVEMVPPGSNAARDMSLLLRTNTRPLAWTDLQTVEQGLLEAERS
jgi:hypothetical protein